MAVIEDPIEEGYFTHRSSDGTIENILASDRHHTKYLSSLSFLKQYEFARWHKPVGPLDYSTMPIGDYPSMKGRPSREVWTVLKERFISERQSQGMGAGAGTGTGAGAGAVGGVGSRTTSETSLVKQGSNEMGDAVGGAGGESETPPQPSGGTTTDSNVTINTVATAGGNSTVTNGTSATTRYHSITSITSASSSSRGIRLPIAAGPSFWEHLRTPEDEIKLCKEGLIHFRGTIEIKDAPGHKVKIAVKLGSPCHDQSNRFGRIYGSDRFLRLNLGRGSLWLSTGDSDQSTHHAKNAMRQFLSRPIVIVGRQFYPFSVKDDSIFYFAVGGYATGLEYISLNQFVKNHIHIKANWKMKVPKFIARFHLGLSRTIPTLSFMTSSEVKIVPDIWTNSLRISPFLMKKIARYFDFDLNYVPSAIEGVIVSPSSSGEKEGQTLTWINDYGRSGRWSAEDAKIELRLPEFQPDSTRSSPKRKTSSEAASETASSSVRIRFFSRESVAEDGVPIRTACVIDFSRNEVVEPRDLLPERTPEELTDGCGLMSEGAMEALRETLDLDELPSAVQGRLGGSKGMWCLDPSRNTRFQHWIEIRPSQLKFEIASDQNLDLEVISFTKPARQVSLGKQVLPILQQNHVPNSVLEELSEKKIQECINPLFKLQDDLPALQQYIEKTENVFGGRKDKIIGLRRREYQDELVNEEAYNDDDEEMGEKVQNDDDEDPFSYAPQTISEVVVQMFSAGFTLDNSALALKFRTMVSNIIDRSLTFQVPVARSTNLYVIPDPVGILQPDEIFVQFSTALIDPETCRPVNVLEDIDVLVTRSPCVARSGIRKVTARNYRELREYFNVIIFPTCGDRSLCSLLGGGDYDGDIVTLVWDPRVVDAFQNSSLDDVDSTVPTEEDFEVDSRTVGEVISHLVENNEDNPAELTLLLTERALFAQRLYGKFSNWHTALSYQLGFREPVVTRAGYLFEKTLDAPKQGHTLRPSVITEFEKVARARVEAKAAETWRPGKGTKQAYIKRAMVSIFNPPEWTFSDKKKAQLQREEKNAIYPRRLVSTGGKFVLDHLIEKTQELKVKYESQLRNSVTGFRKWDIDPDFLQVWQRACRAADKPVPDFKPQSKPPLEATSSVSSANTEVNSGNLSRESSSKGFVRVKSVDSVLDGKTVSIVGSNCTSMPPAEWDALRLRDDLNAIEMSCRSCMKSYLTAVKKRQSRDPPKDGIPKWLAYRQELSEVSERLLTVPSGEGCRSPHLRGNSQYIRRLKAAFCYLLGFEDNHKLSLIDKNNRHFFVLDVAFRDFISIKADTAAEEYGKKRIGEEIVRGARAHPVAPAIYPTLGVKRTLTHYIEKASKKRKLNNAK